MKPKIFVLTTGGTIAHQSEGDEPAVMNFQPQELIFGIGLADIELAFSEVIQKGSMNIVPDDWKTIATATAKVLMEKPQGVVILHGTDTLHYTAAALSFMLRGLSVPVVLTGSMIPGGNAGSDSLANLRDAVRVAAYSDFAEVCIVFSGDPERKTGMIIRGSRARKVHSNTVNAFDSINVPPIGYLDGKEIKYSGLETNKRKQSDLQISTDINPNVALIKLNPATTAGALAMSMDGASGVVLEGTGTGHIRPDLQKVVSSFGKPAVISTQAVYGGERLGLYDVDKAILAIGNIIPGRDMNSETALVKLMWALQQKGDVRSLMLTDIAGEISE